MPKPRPVILLWVSLALTVLSLLPQPAFAQTPAPTASPFQITAPAPGSTVGGLVAIWGSVALPGIQSYTLEFAPTRDAVRWIPIVDPRTGPLSAQRLALWDTTRIPDGQYTLRLRALRTGATRGVEYLDYYVDHILVSNAPRTPTPWPTPWPTPTHTSTPVPTSTPTLQPTPSLEDGVSPYIYLTMLAQYDPLCPEWQQRLSIWVSNVGPITVTNIILTDTLPKDCQPLLANSTEGASNIDDKQVVWTIPSLAPGQAAKFELQIDVPGWLKPGSWLTNRAVLSSDQAPYVARSIDFLLGECPWLKATVAALPLPTGAPTVTPTPSSTPNRPTVRPTLTVASVSIDEETVDRSLDLLTTLVTIALAILTVVMAVLLYQRLGRRR